MAKASTKNTVKKATTDSPETAKRVQKRSVNFKTGQWNLKYLQFVHAFIRQTGKTLEQIAEEAGITRQTIYHWFNKDDAKISSIINFIEKCGYKVSFSLKPATNNVGDALVTINRKEAPETSGTQRLSFLNDAFNVYNISRKNTAEMLGIGYTALYYWFKNDDVFMSYIYKMAEANGLKLTIKIDPAE